MSSLKMKVIDFGVEGKKEVRIETVEVRENYEKKREGEVSFPKIEDEVEVEVKLIVLVGKNN